MHRSTLGAVALIVALAGCGSGKSDALKKETSHLRVLTGLYAKTASELKRNPQDEQEFKEAIGKLGIPLERLRVGAIDELFVSERDGQPFVVVYGRTPVGCDVVAYEQTGVEGIRQLGHKIGMVEEVDEQRLRELVPTSAKAP